MKYLIDIADGYIYILDCPEAIEEAERLLPTGEYLVLDSRANKFYTATRAEDVIPYE